MSGRIYQLLAAVAVILGVAAARAEPGYLPQAGPLPLRFRLPPAVAHQEAPLPLPPPPAAPILLPAPPMPPTLPEPSNAAPAKAIHVAAPTNAPAVEFDARESLAVSPSNAVPDGAISPQMLIKYFTSPTAAATNALSMGMAPPVIGFTPPAIPTPAPPPVK